MRAHLADRPIVIVEDSDEDYEVMIWALREAGVSNPVCRCATAADISCLINDPSQWPPGLLKAYPVLVLLDLNVPGTDWHDTLSFLRGNEWWKAVPVIIVSTSTQPDTIVWCYSVGVAGYLQKLIDLKTFSELIRNLTTYWFETIVPPLPPKAAIY
jgi:CheY-like chemotaxis protein